MTEIPPFEVRSAQYVYVAFADHITLRIRLGDLLPGERLPGERDLAAEYEIAFGTVRRGIDLLRERGLVVTLAAKGTYVVDPVPPEEG
ncbi:winged helix-turn-helix domain-containing protein [Streptosporangium sp. G12]